MEVTKSRKKKRVVEIMFVRSGNHLSVRDGKLSAFGIRKSTGGIFWKAMLNPRWEDRGDRERFSLRRMGVVGKRNRKDRRDM